MSWIALNRLLEPASEPRSVGCDPDLAHADWAQTCLRMAALLQARRCRRVALWFQDTVGLTQALFACWYAGATALLITDAREDTCRQYDAEVDLWISDDALALPATRCVSPADAQDLQALPAMTLDLTQAGVILFTSGSSGIPKPIHKSWAQLSLEVDALESRWHWADTPQVTVLGSVSPRHMYGLIFRALWPLCAGRPLAGEQHKHPETLVQASRRRAPACWITSPALLKRLGEAIDDPGWPGSVSDIFSAGGTLPPTLAQTLSARLKTSVNDIYGSSETGAVAWRHHASWQPLPGVVHALDARGALRLAAPWIGAAVQTEDGAQIDETGFTLLGRLDRIIKIEDTRIALSWVERAIEQAPWAEEAVVGQLPARTRLAALVALNAAGLDVLRRQGRQALVSLFMQSLRKTMPALAVPRHWRFVDAIAWNTQGKLPQAEFESRMMTRPEAPDCERLPPQAGDTSSTRRYRLHIPLELRVFSGHFPAAPVLPGVVQITWAVDLARQDLFPDLRCCAMHTLKFQRLARPGDTLDLILSWDVTKRRLRFQYHQDNEPISSGQIQGDEP